MDSFLWHVYSVSHIVLATGTVAVSKIDGVPSLVELLRHRQPFVTGLPEIKGRHASAQHKDEIPVTTVVQHWAGCLVRKGILCW